MRALVVAAMLVAAAGGDARAGGCVLDSVVNVVFSGYDVLSASPNDSTGSVTYKCLVSLSITIDLSKGTSTTYNARTLTPTSGGSTLSYNLFTDAARTTVWGDATGTTSHYGPVIGLLADFTIPIYGRIPAGQDVKAGSFSDTIVVTLNY